ncbi:hypothetical protein PAMP_020119 [Pampus punctatissimus]
MKAQRSCREPEAGASSGNSSASQWLLNNGCCGASGPLCRLPKINSDNVLTNFCAVAKSGSRSQLWHCATRHNQRATTFRHPVSGQISQENVDFILQEQRGGTRLRVSSLCSDASVLLAAA